MTRRIILALALAVAMTSASRLMAADAPKREFRGVWFTTVFGIDWPAETGSSLKVAAKQRDGLDRYLDRFAGIGLNTVCFQVRSMADAVYCSSLEPWSAYVSGRRGDNPGWDPLEYVVRGSHDRGMECYAWVNPLRWSKGTEHTTPYDNRLRDKGWLLTHGDYTVINPAIPEARRHVLDVCREIIECYNVDGLLFDDYFYPNNIPEDSTAADYNLWRGSGSPLTFGDWRRANIDTLVAEVGRMVADVRPDVRYGIGPAGVACKAETSAGVYGIEPCPVKAPDWQYATIYSDPIAWLDAGSIDFISPQIYWPTDHPTAPYEPLSRWWSGTASAYDRHHYASQSLSRLEKDTTAAGCAQVLTQVDLNRSHTLNDAPGCCFFSGRQLMGRVGDSLAAGPFARPALQPVTRWKKMPSYDRVKHVRLDGDLLLWRPVEPADGQSIVKYTVYAVPADVNVKKLREMPPQWLLGVTYRPCYSLPADLLGNKDIKFAVCVYDGYGNEFKPTVYEQ